MKKYFRNMVFILIVLVIVCIVSLVEGIRIGNSHVNLQYAAEEAVMEEEMDPAEEARRTCQQIMEIDFSVRNYPIDSEKYDEDMDKLYKRAFYRAITNKIPLRYDEQWGASYYRDTLRFAQDMTDEEFEELFIRKNSVYYYLDFTGDGLPELVLDTGSGWLEVFKYLPEEDTVVVYAVGGEYAQLLGSGQMYERVTGIDYIRYSYTSFDKEAENRTDVMFEIVYSQDGRESYLVSVGEFERVEIEKGDWDIATKDFFESIEHEYKSMSFGEVFGDVEDYLTEEKIDINEIYQAYEDFLAGACTVEGINIGSIIGNAREADENRYTILDADRDNVPELHVQTKDSYHILKYQNGNLFLWRRPYFNIPVGEKYNLLTTGNILYEEEMEDGVGERYRYFRLEPSGVESSDIYFSREDSNGNGIYDEKDNYRFEGEACTWAEWIEKTQRYLYIDDMGTVQILGLAEWSQID